MRPLRALAFALGLAAVAIALASPLDGWAAEGSLVAHMAQHELLLNVAPVLLLLGLDVQLAAPLGRAVGSTLAGRSSRLRVLRALAAPALALVLYVGVVAAWHVPGVYAAAAGSAVLHPVEHLSRSGSGCCSGFTCCARCPRSVRSGRRRSSGTCCSGTLGSAALAALLAGAPVALYPESVSSGLDDQRLAGGLMMAVEMPLALAVGYAVLLRAALRSRRRVGSAWLGT